MLIQHDIFVSLGLGAVLVVLVAIAASLTLLPAVLALMGDRVNSLRLPIVYGLQARSEEQAAGGAWDRIARAAMRTPVPSVLLSGGLLVAAAVPLIYMSVGSAGVTALPDSFESKKGFEALARDFPAGLTEPVIVAIDGAVDDTEVQGAIQRLRTALEQDGDFGAVSEDVNPKRDLTRFTVPLAKGDPNGEAAMSAVNRLRDEYISDAFAGVPAMALVTGQTAEVVDHVDIGKDGLKLLIPFILVLSFVLLTLVFRSLVVPVKAAIMNLLSVGAAYGLLVLVFQKGVGSDFLGFQQVETIEWWVPAFLFAVLFGLSMDYHVFLLSRIRERFQETDDNTGSVAYGIRSTGRLITGAAPIMLAVFVGFAAGDLPMFQQMGFGLAVAVVLDGTIVRSVLVPASMRLLGRANWYWPSWLDWVPTFRVERPPEPDPTGSG
jgi:RND superfamily putative drug exporter